MAFGLLKDFWGALFHTGLDKDISNFIKIPRGLPVFSVYEVAKLFPEQSLEGDL